MRDNRSSGFLTRSYTNRSVQSQKQTRTSTFRILEEEELYYLCSENKGSDQLRNYYEADLCLGFRIGKNLFVSSPARSAQSYCCHLGRLRLHLRVRPRPRHTFG